MFGLGVSIAIGIMNEAAAAQQRQAQANQQWLALVAARAEQEAAIHAANTGTTIDGECMEVVPPRLIGRDA